MPRANNHNNRSITIAVRVPLKLDSSIRKLTQLRNYKENKMESKSETVRKALEIGLQALSKEYRIPKPV